MRFITSGFQNFTQLKLYIGAANGMLMLFYVISFHLVGNFLFLFQTIGIWFVIFYCVFYIYFITQELFEELTTSVSPFLTLSFAMCFFTRKCQSAIRLSIVFLYLGNCGFQPPGFIVNQFPPIHHDATVALAAI